jgi:hypothetical protein
MQYQRTERKFMRVAVRSTERDYEVSFDIASSSFSPLWREFKEILETNCELENDGFSREVTGVLSAKFSLSPGRYGQRFVNSEGELFQGEKEVTGFQGAVYRWRWALARCKD